MQTDRAFAQAWLAAQERFWRTWQASSGPSASYDSARSFWNGACEQWWQQIGSTLPPPLDTRTRAALDQINLYLGLAQNLGTAESNGDSDVAHGLEQWLRGAVAAWPGDIDGDYARASSNARCLTAYAALVQQIADIAAAGLEHARERLASMPSASIEDHIDIVCHSVEQQYRERAGSDDFARAVGEWINARVQCFESDDPSNDFGAHDDDERDDPLGEAP